jgi:hypothetical protein
MFMKIRVFLAVGCGILSGLQSAWGALPPRQPELPNFDRRLPGKPDDAVAAAQQQGLLQLQQQIPGVQVTRDSILGLPKWVAARRGFLTGPISPAAVGPSAFAVGSAQPDAPQIIKGFLDGHADLLGYSAQILASARVSRDYVTAHNGLRTVIWEQMVDGIPVFDGLLAGHVTRNGELVSLSGQMIPNAEQAAAAGVADRAGLIAQPPIPAATAIVQAAANLGANLDAAGFQQLQAPEGAEKSQRLTAAQLRGDAYLKLVWLPVSQTDLRLCWRVVVRTRTHAELYLLVVDAQTGEVLVRRCLTNYISPATYNVYTSDSPSPFSPGWSTPNSGQPPLVQRSNVTLSAMSTVASPAGWINDGDQETLGNNVDAHTDVDDNDRPDLPRPNGGPNRVFDFPLDLTQAPNTYTNASVVQLFYLNNFMHDKLYDLGFTEAAGNFQTTNFNRGGLGDDAVQADSQDGSGTDNANFSTPPDGIPGRMQMYVFTDQTPDRDGDLDAEVVCHEYTHGLSNRLVGGGVGIYQLQPAGMGEGWSDFYALSLLSQPGDDPNACYPEGGYVTYQLGGLTENYYYGIRRYPYSTDLNKNPLTFKDIDPTQADPHAGVPISPIAYPVADEVHNMGEVWCVTLWGARALLVEKLGGAEGNRMMLQLTTDAMKLSPANPTYIESRDAILAADEVLTGADNRNELWIAFARRGMGVNAKAPPADTTIGVVEDYTLPDDVVITEPDGILEVKVTPPSRTALFAGTSESIFVKVTDATAVTNATIRATTDGRPGPTFRNDGVAPDQTANNAVYSGTLVVPTTGTSVTLTLIISAPDKDTATNVVTYDIVPPPPNDMFDNATKVPTSGAVYVTNNKNATREPGEPEHGSASLWWVWSSGGATNVLVDTGGSLIDTAIAVYTGTNVAELTQVAFANDVGARKQAYVIFPAKPGVAYKIAVTSPVADSTGTINLRIAPGGQPDITPPVVSITSPPSGQMVGTNRVAVSGTAIDPIPNPSGIDKIMIRVSPNPLGQEEVVLAVPGAGGAILSSNWLQRVALSEGLNVITVTATDVAGNLSSPAELEVTYRPRDPVNDLFVNAIPLSGTNGAGLSNTQKATKEPGEPIHAGNAGGKSVWWSWQAPADGVLTLATTNSTFDTLLAVYQGTRVNALTPVASNDDALPDSGYSKVSFAVRANQIYRVAVDGFDGVGGLAYLHYEFGSSQVYSLTVNATGGGTVTPGSGPVAAGSTIFLTAVPNSGYDFIGWEGDVVSTANPLSLTISGSLTLTARFAPHQYTDGFESGNFSTLHWTPGGNAPWRVQTNQVAAGNFAAQSGVISNYQSSNLKLAFNSTGGFGSFAYRVSSEADWDYLEFYLNGVLQQKWSGEVGWANFAFPVPAGVVNLEWHYMKDPSRTNGLDTAFLDNVDLPLAPNSVLLANATPHGFRVQLQGLTGQQVRIQRSTDLHTWADLTTVTPVNGVVDFVDPSPPAGPTRFYRALAQ